MAFGPRGDLIICNYGSKQIVRIYCEGDKVCRQRLPVGWGHPAAIAISMDGRRLAVAVQEHHAESEVTGGEREARVLAGIINRLQFRHFIEMEEQ